MKTTRLDLPDQLVPDVQYWLQDKDSTTRETDFQRSRVYKWERATFEPTLGAPISEHEIREIAVEVCSHFHLPVSPISFTRARAYAGQCSISRGINISVTTGMSRWVILHELAHWVVQNWGRTSQSRLLSCHGHGPLFVRVYAYILETFAFQSRDQIIASARASGVRVALVPVAAPTSPQVLPGANPAPKAPPRPSQAGHPRCLWCGNARYARVDSHFCTHVCALAYAVKAGIVPVGTKPSSSLTATVESLPEIMQVRWFSTRVGWLTPGQPGYASATDWPAAPQA